MVLFIAGGARFAIGLTLKPIVDQFGWGRSELGIAVGLFQVVSAVAMFAAGHLADRISPRTVLAAGLFVSGIAIGLMSAITAPWQAMVLYGVVFGLGATIITNKRRIAADDFFTGMFSTALEENEIILKVSFPIAKKAAYEKFKHPASGFALVGVFVSKRGADIRVAVTGAGANGVFRVKSFEEALKKRFAAKSLEGMSIPANGMNADIHGSAEYRAHLVGVLARRALAKATA